MPGSVYDIESMSNSNKPLQHRIDDECNEHIGLELTLYQTRCTAETHIHVRMRCVKITSPSISLPSVHPPYMCRPGSLSARVSNVRSLHCRPPSRSLTRALRNVRHLICMGPDCCGLHKVCRMHPSVLQLLLLVYIRFAVPPTCLRRLYIGQYSVATHTKETAPRKPHFA